LAPVVLNESIADQFANDSLESRRFDVNDQSRECSESHRLATKHPQHPAPHLTV
jgi:hypothetical protein